MKRVRILVLLTCAVMLIGCGKQSEPNKTVEPEPAVTEKEGNIEKQKEEQNPEPVVEDDGTGDSQTTEVIEPDTEPAISWVNDLQIAQTGIDNFILVTAEGSRGTLTFYEKNSVGIYEELISCEASIGKNGIGKSAEGDRKTPTGMYHFINAFGIAANPGCKIGYTQVDDSYYWVDDSASAYYNKFVSTNWDGVQKDWSSAEHIIDVKGTYNYVLSLDYNAECTPGKGSAIFLHCTPTSGAGCIAVTEEAMKTIITRVNGDSVIIIDGEDNIRQY